MSLGKGILEIISVSSFLMQGSVAVQSPHVQSTVTLQLSPASVLGKLPIGGFLARRAHCECMATTRHIGRAGGQ